MNDPKQPVTDLDSLLTVLDVDQLENVSGGYSRMNCDMDGVQEVADNGGGDDWGGGGDDWGGGGDDWGGGGDWA